MTRFTIKRYDEIGGEPTDDHHGRGHEVCPERDLNRSLLHRRSCEDSEECQRSFIARESQSNAQIVNCCDAIEDSKPIMIDSKINNNHSNNNDNHTGTTADLPPRPNTFNALQERRHFPFVAFKSTNQNQLLAPTSDPPTTSSGMATVSPLSYSPVAQRGRTFANRHTKRLVFKDGTCNVTSANVTQKKKKYLVDIFTTCVDMRWRYLLALFAGAFLCSWIVFGVAWYAIAISLGDHLLTNGNDQTTPDLFRILPGSSNASLDSNSSVRTASKPRLADRRPCVNNVFDFPTALLFSIETQHTIGYGYRVVEPTCPFGILLLMAQSCIGIFVQSLMTGLIFAKLSQPKKRAHTIMFSKCAVITKRDGVYCLLFRVGDMRRSHFVATSIRALLVKDRVTKERECIPLCQYPLDVKTETSSGDAFVFMVWPVVVVHKIDSSSPLWNLSASQLLQEKFEIIVIMEGIVESTGMTTQVRTSYLPGEILWGHCLAPLLTYQKENGQYKIDYAQFHSIVGMADMPECSAMEFSSKRSLDDRLEEHAELNTSPYFTIPSKMASHSGRGVSVMQRVRGSLKLRRTKKDKPAVPCTAPVLHSSVTHASSVNVFFDGVKNEDATVRIRNDAKGSCAPSKIATTPEVGARTIPEASNFSSLVPSVAGEISREGRGGENGRTQIGSCSSDRSNKISGSSISSSDGSEVNGNPSSIERQMEPRFAYDISVPIVSVAFS